MKIFRERLFLIVEVLLGVMLVIFSLTSHGADAQVADKPSEPEVAQTGAGVRLNKILLDGQSRDGAFQFIWNLTKQTGQDDMLWNRMTAPITITLTLSDSQGRALSKYMTLDIGEQALTQISQPEAQILVSRRSSKPAADVPAMTMVPVQPGTYALSAYLKRYIQYLAQEAVIIDAPFSVQAGEVTVGEFRRYATDLNEAQREALGTRWERSADGQLYPDEQPVENVSWQHAAAYTNWLSRQTGWDLRLPTLEQWVAACAKYAEHRPVLLTERNQPLTEIQGPIDHLLGNVREWSSTACEDGKYRVLGENYMTSDLEPHVVGEGHCVGDDEQWSGLGFRVVRIEQE